MPVEKGPELVTERLRLRRWRPEDLEPFAALNADPAVMEYFPGTLDRRASDELVERIEAGFDEWGYGLWATEVLATGRFVGFVGLAHWAAGDLPIGEVVEVGWRLAHDVWGHGLAPEAAVASLAFGFEQLGLGEIVSMTAVVNLRSRRVMEKIGLRLDARAGFEHPRVPAGSPVRSHVLYRLGAAEWSAAMVGQH